MTCNILIIDDDADFCKEFKDCFAEYAICDAQSARSAMDILSKPNEIDLVFLDVSLPDMKGTELLNVIRQDYPSLSVIIMTGYGSKDVVVEALRAQATDYIEKPIDIPTVKAFIQKIVDCKDGGIDSANGTARDKINRVKTYIERNVLKKVELEDAAKLVYITPKYLSRLFKDHTGVNFCDYKLSIKMKEAQKLLSKSNLSIEQIAYNLGYANVESFTRIFHQRTKKTPSQYRKQNR